MKNRILVFAMAAVAAIGMISCGNPQGDAEQVKTKNKITAENVDSYVTDIGNYVGLTVEAQKEEMTEDMILYYTQFFFESEASAVTSWVSEIGDTVNVDFVGKIDGKAFEGGTGTNESIVIGSHTYIEGFEDGLVGAKAGDELVLNLKFPETYKNEELAGKTCTFDVKVNSVIPALTDESVKALNNELYASVSEFNIYIKDVLTGYLQKNYEEEVVQGIITKLIETSTFADFTEDILKAEKETVLESYKPYADAYEIEPEYYLELLGTSSDELSLVYAKQHTLLYKIAKENDLLPTEDELFEQIEPYIEYYDDISSAEDYYEKEMTRDDLFEAVMLNKVYDYLLGVTEVVAPKE